ncbi:MAG: hypothetical protein ACK5RV_10080 [Flavobacterium sp.]|jgi:hypothetical protein|uniref:hypothetical protein n=1 Tax=Flavobacterium sp. TaxID=239 RepID=UPI0022C0C7E6|nr:hypothetical protein [Flavobacterium sp.]MCZ8168373.1 hypothetical protein [Flavobacterium sp.]MCZ8296669.1 hypothetical protein [Flavobacterium sp.]
MSATPQSPAEREIDLFEMKDGLGNFSSGIMKRLFQFVSFFINNRKFLIVLFGIGIVLGVVLGVVADYFMKSYSTQVIVTPNFGSNDYLYSKVELLNSKIVQGDTLFLKNVVGIQEPKKVAEISVKPITDVYRFIENRPDNFELIRLMSEDADIKKIIEDNVTSKNYPYHQILVTSAKPIDKKKVVDPILKYINASEYFKKIQAINIQNVKNKIVANDLIIRQIDGVLNGFSQNVNGSQKSDKLIYFNENTQLNDIIKSKNDLVIEQGNHKIELVNYEKIVKEINTSLNLKNTKGINGKMKFIFPLLFVFIFTGYRFFKMVYLTQKNKL